MDLHFSVNGGTLSEGTSFKTLIKHKQTNNWQQHQLVGSTLSSNIYCVIR